MPILKEIGKFNFRSYKMLKQKQQSTNLEAKPLNITNIWNKLWKDEDEN